MRVPRALCWILIVMAMFTAGLLRQYHDLTPVSPFLGPVAGSLLLACVVFLLLVAARERQIGAAPGPGVRLGSLTPLLLMLLVEKWIASALYQPLFAWAAPADLSDDAADAWFRLLCGIGLLAIVGIAARFSRPASSWVRTRLFGWKPLAGVGAVAIAVTAAGLLLALFGVAAGTAVSVLPPDARGPLALVLVGQGVIALAEETYYRGLVLGELMRLAPRLGLHAPAARRWVALGMTTVLFGMEHLGSASTGDDAARQLMFALALGALLAMIVLLTNNIWFAASLHAWINWLLLGAAPRLVYGPAQAGLPPGASVSLTLIAAFVAAFVMQRRISTR